MSGSEAGLGVRTSVGPGLRGVVAAVSRRFRFEPADGRVDFHGVPVGRLAEQCPFERVAWFVLSGQQAVLEADGGAGYTAFVEHARRARREAMTRVGPLVACPGEQGVAGRMAAAVSALACVRPGGGREPAAAGAEPTERAAAGAGAAPDAGVIGARLGAVWGAMLAALAAEERVAGAGRAGDGAVADVVFALLRGRAPDERERRALEALWVALVDDGLEPGTFAGLVVASCLASWEAVVSSSLAAWAGRKSLPVRVADALKRLNEITDAGGARAWCAAHLAPAGAAEGVEDPRAAVLRRVACDVSGQARGWPARMVVEAVETRQESAGVDRASVAGWSALVLGLLGISARAAAGVVVMARVVGLLGRVEEYVQENRLFRPLTRYVGPQPRAFVPLEQR